MRMAREALGAVLLGTLSLMIVIGGIALTLAEANLLPVAPAVTQPTPTVTASPASALEITPAQSSSATLPPSPTFAPTTTNCPSPVGWQPLFVQPGDTLDSLALTYNVSPDLLAQQNCLIRTASLPPGAVVYVPPAPNTPRPTVAPTRCGPPATWIVYVVRPGDTLYRIATAYGITVSQLKLANCLVSDGIVSGQRLYVPNVPTRTPTVTLTPAATPTVSPTLEPATPTDIAATPVDNTPTPVPPTPTDAPPTASPFPTETSTP